MLVFCDFPANLTEAAAKRLAGIVNSGARCGVHTMILRDERIEWVPGIDQADLRSRSLCLQHREGRWGVASHGLQGLPFEPELPPAAERLIPLLRRIGKAAKEGSKVEVPFEMIAPKPDALWSGSTATSVQVPLGRTGATRLQMMTLGVGTSQHALIAGKTGSGKSTLLHALITNLALWYSPDEVEFYLVDFKKGVEFKTYATHRLPHARVVAVESDREFGLSVLQGLDGELKRRGDLYRQLGVQDLASYRRTGHPVVLPRVLLIIDEFQELFIEDDRIAQDANLLLDRLVRQGRAFGMHVVLGSQTLSGAFSLARTTMGQMGVRIALQCSEADSQVILSDENLAARLLSRPGEAIYNDAGGLLEGNSPFQVVWLPDQVREQWLNLAQLKAQAEPPSGRSRRSSSRATPPLRWRRMPCSAAARRQGRVRWRRAFGWARRSRSRIPPRSACAACRVRTPSWWASATMRRKRSARAACCRSRSRLRARGCCCSMARRRMIPRSVRSRRWVARSGWTWSRPRLVRCPSGCRNLRLR